MEISDEQFKELLNRYLNGLATPSERELLDNFFQSYEAELTRQDLTPDQLMLGDSILKKIHAQAVKKEERGRGRLISLWLPIAAAISVFVLVGIFFGVEVPTTMPGMQLARIVQDSTGPGQRIVRVLPDGTRVHLNSRTKVSYPETFGSVRHVSLIGEGYFEVVRNGQPFIVESGNVTTEVLGTSFNVKYRSGSKIEITLAEGKVNVASHNQVESLGLEPGEQVVVDLVSSRMEKRNVDVIRHVGWKDNILAFERTSFEDAIRQIEEWYAVEIDIANPFIRGCMITAKYQNEPLGNVLSSLQFLLALDIERLDVARFRVDGNGCE